jgi:hypothetical protein
MLVLDNYAWNEGQSILDQFDAMCSWAVLVILSRVALSGVATSRNRLCKLTSGTTMHAAAAADQQYFTTNLYVQFSLVSSSCGPFFVASLICCAVGRVLSVPHVLAH